MVNALHSLKYKGNVQNKVSNFPNLCISTQPPGPLVWKKAKINDFRAILRTSPKIYSDLFPWNVTIWETFKIAVFTSLLSDSLKQRKYLHWAEIETGFTKISNHNDTFHEHVCYPIPQNIFFKVFEVKSTPSSNPSEYSDTGVLGGKKAC